MAIQLESGKSGRRIRPTMNVTPLVDVVLVLLIIFMIMTQNMARVMSLHVPTPSKSAEPEEPQPDDEVQVVLTVTSDGTIQLNQEDVADRDLPDKLRRVFAARDDQTLFFDAADDAPYGRAVEVLDAARGTGLATIAVLTEPI
ncbi:MAG TPA: biopolymer transporter ExbD [Kofleriaceae bacterium]|jgi:biopolymer transport protein ExbD/biopolymer transport protein TolR